MLALLAFSSQAAPPPAGSTISNTASASYTDASAVSRTVTSNPVSTTVLQVAALTLTANGAQSANPGTTVNYPHTLTNTGNGSDTFNLTAVNTAGPVVLSNIQIFLDNGSGLPTGPAITNTGALAVNGTFKFIVQGTVPAGATNATTSTVTVTATSTTDNTKTASNTDTTTVTTNAVVTLTKAISATSGAPGSGPYTYTLTYTNTGNSTATAVTISDNIPAGMLYVANSARWSVTGVTALSDSGGTTAGPGGNTVTSNYTGTTFTATINQVTQGQSGVLTFNVTVPAGTTPGLRNNIANLSYNNGAATATGSSGAVGFTVTSTAGVTFTGPATPTATAAAGSTVSFTNVLTNTGTSTDSFNITIGTNTFPPGTTFQLFAPDGFTPITNTGPVAPGAAYNVIVKAILPANATGTGPFTVNNVATSVADPTKSATAVDTLNALTTAKVDLTLDTPAGPGLGVGPEAASVQTKPTNPGTTTQFTLVANNGGGSADAYNLGASAASNFGTALPTGWVVTYTAGACPASGPATGPTITTTSNIAAGGSASVCASVTVPASYPAGTQDVYFRLQSPGSSASDIVHAAVTVNAVRSLTISNPGTGQTFPSGQVVYSHVLTNTGNVNEGNGTLSSIALSAANNQPGWTSTLYYDAGSLSGAGATSTGDGVLTASDPIFSGNLNTIAGLSAGLAPGQSITIFDKVIAPSGAPVGSVNTTTISVAVTNGTYTTTVPVVLPVQDNTSIVAGNLTLTKAQALDAACAGPVVGQTYSPANLTAKPGQCILYQVTVTNVGSANATAVVLNDSTPGLTTLSTAPAIASGAGTGTVATGAPAVGGTGVISVNAGSGTNSTPNSGGTLIPGAATVFTFGVKVNQ